MAINARTSAGRAAHEVYAHVFEARILPTDAVGPNGAPTDLCTAQAFSAIAAASGVVTIDGVTTAKSWFRVGGQAWFARPQFLTIQCSAPGAGTNQGTFTIRGRNQFDEDVLETVAYASGTSSTNTGKTCWRHISSITFFPTTPLGDAAATVSIGWKMSNNALTFPPRLPLPFKVKASADLVAIIVEDLGGGSFAAISLGSSIGSPIVDLTNHTVSFVTGVVTTQPTTPMKFVLIMGDDTRAQR